jgi:hypothetical protein
MVRMADQAGMKALHMITTGDSARNATFVLFADPDYFITDFPSSTCKTCIQPSFAWNHGDIQPEIADTWLAFVGPGLRTGTTLTWSDHADVRPTMLALLGLADPYVHDGRVLVESMEAWAAPVSLRAHRETLLLLGQLYKQLNAPFGRFGMNLLDASTRALQSGSAADDSRYQLIEGRVADLTERRDATASRIQTLLDGAAFGHQPVEEREALRLAREATLLLIGAELLAHAPGIASNGF